MKKTVAHSIICLLVVILQILTDVIPLTRYPLKLKFCEISIDDLIQHEKLIIYTDKMNQAERNHLAAIKSEICNQ